ncbi:3570_t:CDS:1, partial [Paraglomus occultum]
SSQSAMDASSDIFFAYVSQRQKSDTVVCVTTTEIRHRRHVSSYPWVQALVN